jgi:hypothetical protein
VKTAVSGHCHFDRREKLSRVELKWKNIRARLEMNPGGDSSLQKA